MSLVTIALGFLIGVGWMRSRRRIPTGLSQLPTAAVDVEGGGPSSTSGPAWVACATACGDLAAVANLFSARYRLVLVAPETQLGFETQGHPCFRATSTDRLDVERMARALSRTDGAPVAVLICCAETLSDPGAIQPPPVVALSDGLGLSAWLIVLDPGERPADVPFASWRRVGSSWTRTDS